MEEKQKEFYTILNTLNDNEYMKIYLIYSLSPVIAGFKPSSTINFKREYRNLYFNWNEYGKSFIKELGLDYISLREEDDYVVVLIYRSDTLEKHLREQNNLKFLSKLEYDENDSVEAWLSTLKKRYELYHCPHELGVFLGIPIEDVIDFMECSSKKCLMCGYWKVYNDYYKAQEIFNTYDKSKEYVVNNVLEGRSILSLVQSIQTNFFNHQYCI
ncbi:DUF3793 family protein [Clostridium carnis]